MKYQAGSDPKTRRKDYVAVMRFYTFENGVKRIVTPNYLSTLVCRVLRLELQDRALTRRA